MSITASHSSGSNIGGVARPTSATSDTGSGLIPPPPPEPSRPRTQKEEDEEAFKELVKISELNQGPRVPPIGRSTVVFCLHVQSCTYVRASTHKQFFRLFQSIPVTCINGLQIKFEYQLLMTFFSKELWTLNSANNATKWGHYNDILLGFNPSLLYNLWNPLQI